MPLDTKKILANFYILVNQFANIIFLYNLVYKNNNFYISFQIQNRFINILKDLFFELFLRSFLALYLINPIISQIKNYVGRNLI